MVNLMPVESFDNIVVSGTGRAWAVFGLDPPPGMASYRFHADAAVAGYAHQLLSWIRSLPLETRLLSVASPIRPEDLARAVADAPDLAARLSPTEFVVDCGGGGRCGPNSVAFSLQCLGVFSEDGDRLRAAVVARAPPPMTKLWAGECTASHSTCAPTSKPPCLPGPSLLDVSTSLAGRHG